MYGRLRDELMNVPVYKDIYNDIRKGDMSLDSFMNVYKILEEKDKQKKLAQLEGSKTFCRDLLSEIDDSLNPKHKDFYNSTEELKEYIYNF